MDPFLQKVHDRPIGGRYHITRKIGEGGFGVVYLGQDALSGDDVAMKLEHRSVEPSVLAEEASRYGTLQDVDGFPQVFWFGWHDDFKVMVFELLGPSLEDLFRFCESRFSLKTTLMVVDQILVRLEKLHAAGILHRDIKPRNFLLGTGLNGNVVYVTDLGLAEEYVASSAYTEDVRPRWPRLVGTVRFASLRGHEGRLQSPRDDLESLGYMILYFMRGKLPWQGLKTWGEGKQEEAVMNMKKELAAERLCRGLPQEFAQYMHDVQSLRRDELPDYEKLRRLFRDLAGREGIEYDNVFDWTMRVYLASEHTKGK